MTTGMRGNSVIICLSGRGNGLHHCARTGPFLRKIVFAQRNSLIPNATYETGKFAKWSSLMTPSELYVNIVPYWK